MVTALRDTEAGGLAWREAGDGSPALILLHGLGGSRSSWDDQLRTLGGDRRCVAWDAPGYGAARALPRPLTFPALADAVARLADALGPERPHLAGLSFGGQIAQHAALAHPHRFRSLTLLSTSPAFGLDGTQPDAWRAARLAPLDAGQEPADFAEVVLRGVAGPHISDEALAAQRRAMERISAAGLRDAIECLVGHDLRGQLGAIELPTLVLVGELDDETPRSYAEAIATEIPGARLEVVAGAGHLLNAEAPDTVNALIRDHLAAVEAA